jgi:hypothetical protein
MKRRRRRSSPERDEQNPGHSLVWTGSVKVHSLLCEGAALSFEPRSRHHHMAMDNRRLGRSLLEASYVRKRSAIALLLVSGLLVIGGTIWLFKPAVLSKLGPIADFLRMFAAS